jgi:YtcA family
MPPKITGRWTEKLTGTLRSPLGRIINRAAAAGATFAPALFAAGCSRAPSFNILGSFFPAWIGCGIIGILLASLVRWWFVRIKLEDHLLWPLILVYPCLTAFFTFTLWLLFFS